ncbi:hypothetical protein AB0D04_07800 [Streptomyces sp. NPDC048483]|uniref:hypothetical protein n=1 Tax=Streptomyces sp. NPDC048483 TaxID=3154927 RepID=UPI0034411F2E
MLIGGPDRRLMLANDEARRLLELPADAEQRDLRDLGLEADFEEMLASCRKRSRAAVSTPEAPDRPVRGNPSPVHPPRLTETGAGSSPGVTLCV